VNLRKIVDTVLKQKWTKETIHKYIGDYESSWLMYSQVEEIRQNAASGGVITSLLAYLLESDKIDGALVLTSSVVANEVVTQYEIATSQEDLVRAQGSKYITTNFSRDAVPLIKAFKGRLGVVLLPCDSWTVNRLRSNNEEINQKIVIRITLFCGHISDPGLTRMMIQRRKPQGVSLMDFRYREGHWRGNTRYDLEDQSSIEKPFNEFSKYQNLYFYCARKCLRCHDHTGYDSDLSVGDVWLMAMKHNPIKHNAVIVRNSETRALVENAIDENYLTGHQVPIEMVADAQSRSLPLHYNVSARARAGKLLGIKLNPPAEEKVRVIDFLVAYVILFNYRLTTTQRGRAFLRKLPKPVIMFYLYFLKGLEIW
jgi:coenzyme F420-reducing hydrogenase beta subunit